MISMLLDESILVREWRRWKSQRRWRLLLAASVPCGYVSLWVIIPLFLGSAPAHPSDLQWLRTGIGVLSWMVMLSSFLLAFVQSMQVLRREAMLQTLDGLFLTRQTSRGVMMSVIACGVAAGLAISALFLPAIVMAAVAARVGAAALIASVALDLGLVLLGAALGGLWFFVNQNGFGVKVTPPRAALHVLLLAGFFALCWVYGLAPGQHFSPVMALSVLGLYGLAGAVVLSARVLLKEAREIRQPGHPDDGGVPQHGLAKLLTAIALVGSSVSAFGALAIGAEAPRGFMDLANPISIGSCFWPFSAAMDLFWQPINSQGAIDSAVANLQTTPEMSLERAVVITALELLLSAAMAVCACRLYRERRVQPESLAPSRPEGLSVVAVGRDDWRGFGNPILTRELRTRLRSGDARMFLNIAAIVSVAAALGPVLTSLGSSISPTVVASMARGSFLSVSLVQLAIVCIFGPGVGAEVIAVEREHKTYEMLLASRLSASEILWGKVQGCMALLLLLISPALPLLALAAYLHGVTVVSVLLMTGMLGFFVLIVSLLSVSISALSRTSVTGKSTAYVLAGMLACFSCWAPFTLVSSGSWLVQGALYLFVTGNVVTLLWFAALNRVQGRRLPARESFVPPASSSFSATRTR